MNKQSESPKERINVTYKPATGDMTEEIEIPYKITLLGEYNPNEEKKPVEEKKVVKIDKNNFNDVLKAQDLSVTFNVDNKLTQEEDSSLNVDLKINSIKDFSPEKIVENIPELKVLMQLRQSLMALKGPLGNVPAFRKAIEDAISNKEERDKLMNELNLGVKE
ncbi:type VI secretion system contractile sheath small subunit [Malaciobacter marinus]|uniref:Type VI secretion system contractile sheath small subunit n=1 Tax=Malaciobacter marinus TaxID=505249 RepID=A0A347TKK0_9BACT|nr:MULTISPECIES: type VI secretion system contractile sheath small subunit [Malaciobacter]AXX87128.1 type VI secretion system, tubular sheath protein [Malaciobacter marinus]PHO12284.1 type VI secretion system contractile sheath small subunit [Malaciobacter marinus]PHO16337.1 type VI secretion system contractile sheath small subunit [Malaciobacter marinus]RYA22187.1 type VI secretion system contractile sheath small subunit [Malaciobacter halophilus]